MIFPFKKRGYRYHNFHVLRLCFSEEGQGSVARSVVAQLAIYKGDSSENKLRNADGLMLSLEIYHRHFGDIFSGIGLARTHDRGDSDQLAPYYGPSSIPYVFDALSVLEKEKELNTEQRNQLKKIRSEITEKVLGMITPNGLFRQQHADLYSASHYYDNALVGLSLLNACQSGKSAQSTSRDDTNTSASRETPLKPNHLPRRFFK